MTKMKKRAAAIFALASLLPIGKPLFLGTGVGLTTAGAMLIVPQRANAESATFYFDRAFQKGESGDHYGAISD